MQSESAIIIVDDRMNSQVHTSGCLAQSYFTFLLLCISSSPIITNRVYNEKKTILFFVTNEFWLKNFTMKQLFVVWHLIYFRVYLHEIPYHFQGSLAQLEKNRCYRCFELFGYRCYFFLFVTFRFNRDKMKIYRLFFYLVLFVKL